MYTSTPLFSLNLQYVGDHSDAPIGGCKHKQRSNSHVVILFMEALERLSSYLNILTLFQRM